jgi:CRISPR/Cas system CSM-associated protein Csm4 (group 5 of RAMP superfamily)
MLDMGVRADDHHPNGKSSNRLTNHLKIMETRSNEIRFISRKAFEKDDEYVVLETCDCTHRNFQKALSRSIKKLGIMPKTFPGCYLYKFTDKGDSKKVWYGITNWEINEETLEYLPVELNGNVFSKA